MSTVFEDPMQLVKADKVTEFWPNNSQSSDERINATARFIIYATCIIYLIKRDARIFVLGATVLGVLYVMQKSNMIKEGVARPVAVRPVRGGACQRPTPDNPMGNVLLSDYNDNPDRPSACYYPTIKQNVNVHATDRIPYGPARSRSALPQYQRNALSRQFVSSPVTDIPGDQTAYAEWLYGGKNRPMCRSDPRMCDPAARGVQLGAFAGLDPNGDKRSGMHRGSGLGGGLTT